ncbi:MAG: MarR family transcriptional regulator [Acidimicrobiia bacterium]|nr:MarR family transcriptional regulator [Acidimicrobiia bacterium]
MYEIKPDEFRLWRAFLAAQVAIVTGIESELGGLTDVSLGDLEVLASINESGGRMRMAELAHSISASRSGLTRRVDRLKSQGLVERASVPSDKRGAYAVITSAGRRHLEDVMPGYQSLVARRFLSVLESEERETLLRLLERLNTAAAFDTEQANRL